MISLLTALLVYAALQLMIVRPLRRITESVIAFRGRPEDASVDAAGHRAAATRSAWCRTS